MFSWNKRLHYSALICNPPQLDILLNLATFPHFDYAFWWRRQLNLSNSLPTSSGIHKSLQVISRYTYPQQFLAIFQFISPLYSNSPDGWLIANNIYIYIYTLWYEYLQLSTLPYASCLALRGSVSDSLRNCVYAALPDKLFHTVFTWIALLLADWLI